MDTRRIGEFFLAVCLDIFWKIKCVQKEEGSEAYGSTENELPADRIASKKMLRVAGAKSVGKGLRPYLPIVRRCR